MLKKQLDRTNGTKWTSLHCLPYFDTSKFTVVEPMRNLCLGTLKHLVSLLAKDDQLDNKNIKKMKKHFTDTDIYTSHEYPVAGIPRKIQLGTGFSY